MQETVISFPSNSDMPLSVQLDIMVGLKSEQTGGKRGKMG